MSSCPLPSPGRFDLRVLLIVLTGLLGRNVEGQILNAPPTTTASGSAYNAVIITAGGGLTATGLTINPGNGQANGISATATSPAFATGSFTSTTVNLSGGGLTGVFANGTGASVMLGAGSSIVGLNGGGNYGVRVNGGTVTLVDGALINISGGGGNFPIAAYGGGTFDMTGGSVTAATAAAMEFWWAPASSAERTSRERS